MSSVEVCIANIADISSQYALPTVYLKILCSDPTSVAKKSADTAIVYDYPNCSSLAPTTEPCIAYGAASSQLSTESCFAYGAASTRAMKPCIASSQPICTMESCVAYAVHPET